MLKVRGQTSRQDWLYALHLICNIAKLEHIPIKIFTVFFSFFVYMQFQMIIVAWCICRLFSSLQQLHNYHLNLCHSISWALGSRRTLKQAHSSDAVLVYHIVTATKQNIAFLHIQIQQAQRIVVFLATWWIWAQYALSFSLWFGLHQEENLLLSADSGREVHSVQLV